MVWTEFKRPAEERRLGPEGGFETMRDPEKGLPLFLGPPGGALKRAALDRQFDRAAESFYLRYGELQGLSLREFLSRFERAVVFATLIRTHGSQKETAALLKVKKQTLNWKVKKQRIQITKQIVKQPE
jgi:DNA-binding NtrC family response regulator